MITSKPASSLTHVPVSQQDLLKSWEGTPWQMYCCHFLFMPVELSHETTKFCLLISQRKAVVEQNIYLCILIGNKQPMSVHTKKTSKNILQLEVWLLLSLLWYCINLDVMMETDGWPDSMDSKDSMYYNFWFVTVNQYETPKMWGKMVTTDS